MKKIDFVLVLLLLSVVTAFGTVNSTKNRIKTDKPTLKVIGDETPVMIRIPPPLCYTQKSAKLEGGAQIIVTYNGFTTQSKAAFQKAVDIWASLIQSPVKIHIDAYWRALDKTVLGQCGATNYYRDYDGMSYSNTFYPIALAEKMAGEELSDSADYEMIASFNKSAEWYLGTDGITPSIKYDLVSVVLHEICHGLGFTSSFSADRNSGSWGWGTGSPVIYDRFITDSKDSLVLNENIYPNNSSELKDVLTSQILYFSAPVLKTEFGRKALLYAPGSWDSGSSISHVATSYSSGAQSMMTYALNKGKSVHDPGILALSILDDVGWKQLRIEHQQVLNSETISNVQISAKILPDFSTSVLNPKLFYSKDSSDYVEINLSKGGSDTTTFSATIPISKSVNVSYYMTADDKYGRTFKLPVSSPETNFSFFIGADTIPPEIKHFPNTFLLPGQDSILFNATITDGFGIDTVWVEYSYNGAEKIEVPLKKIKENKYQLILDISSLEIQVGDSVNYRILARDKSIAKNVRSYPAEGTIKMNVENIPDFVESYENSFEGLNGDFILQGFEIYQPGGFSDNALHSLHPYEFAGEDSYLEYIAQIRYPVKVDATNHFMRFDEIALVEPGEDGSVYGSEDFYDYVVVEASKDEGKTWIAIEQGWDCRYNDTWNTAYNQAITSQFSQAIGSPSMYNSHLIDLIGSGNIAAGDIILVRFRLHSDPYAYGWGWAIDNLKIQTVGLSNQQLKTATDFKVYPNPVKGHELTVDANGETIDEVILYNLQGAVVFKTETIGDTHSIQLPENIKGGYILYVNTDKHSAHFKIMVE